jgi:hypothetical protein
LSRSEVAAGRSILDPNRFVLDTTQPFPELRFVLLRVAFLAAEWFGVDLATATVRREHQAFYRRVLRYRVAAEARAYPTLRTPLSLMVADFPAERRAVVDRYPFFKARNQEMAGLFGRRMVGPKRVPEEERQNAK